MRAGRWCRSRRGGVGQMSEIAAELARVTDAFAQPTLTLLHQRQAPVVVTIFRAAFGRDNKPIPTARLHTLVDQHVAEMRRNGATDVPAGTGKELCQDRKSTRLNSSH